MNESKIPHREGYLIMRDNWQGIVELADAHVHFDMSKEDPVKDLVEYAQRFRLNRMVLILNKKEEWKVLLEHERLLKDCFGRVTPVFGMNQKDAFYQEGKEFCKKHGKRFHVKLHPRLFGIKEKDIGWYAQKIEEVCPSNIIVDDFLYGNSVQEDMGLKLVCALAERFPSHNIVMAHVGGANLVRHVMQTKVFQNVYYDISLTCNYLFDSSIKWDLLWLLKHMHSRVMLGSDYPDFHIYQAVENLEKLREMSGLEESHWKQMLFYNMEMIYGD